MSSSPYELITAFQARNNGRTGGFAMSRLVLLARIIPEDITPELDDPMLAERIREAIDRIEAYEARRAGVKALVANARSVP